MKENRACPTCALNGNAILRSLPASAARVRGETAASSRSHSSNVLFLTQGKPCGVALLLCGMRASWRREGTGADTL